MSEKKNQPLPAKYYPLGEKGLPVELPVRYGIGIKHDINEYGMIAGPFEDIMECLKEVGGKRQFVIELPSIRLMYKWNDKDVCWERINV